MIEPVAKERDHETRDLNVRALSWFALGLVLAFVVISAAVIGLYKVFDHRQPSPDAPSRIALQPHMIAPQPQLQTAPAADLRRFQSSENQQLQSYGWVDQSTGIIRIPIERAMDLIVRRGLPTRGPGTENASGVTAVEMQKRKAEATKP